MTKELIISRLKQNDYLMRQLDEEIQAEEIAECYIHYSPHDGYELMKALESNYGWTGTMESCELLDEAIHLIEG